MDWKDLARLVAPMAPTLGGLLGDLTPIPGGGTAGRWAGERLAEYLGTAPTPAAVRDALEHGNPEHVRQAVESAEAEAESWKAEAAKADAADRTAQSGHINATMRAEIAAGVSWWHWRHLLGYVVMLQVVGLTIPVLKDLWVGNVANITAVQGLITAITPLYLGLLAVLGYVAGDSTRLKETAITGQAREGIVAAVVRKARA